VGLVLEELQPYLPADCVCWGYDISPEALAMCANRGNKNLRFRLFDIRKEDCDSVFDLLFMLDVFEHVEDYIGLVRAVRSKAKQKLFHIPLDLSVQAVLRKKGLILRRDQHAHLHYFTKETALRTLTDVGYKIVDYFYTPRCIELGDLFVQKMARIPRKISFAVLPDLTVRVLGGYSLLIRAVCVLLLLWIAFWSRSFADFILSQKRSELLGYGNGLQFGKYGSVIKAAPTPATSRQLLPTHFGGAIGVTAFKCKLPRPGVAILGCKRPDGPLDKLSLNAPQN
jgi:Methyltransferase domain